MKASDARTRYNDQVDVSNPKWRKARESLWRKDISRNNKGDGIPYALTEQYKRVFLSEIETVPVGMDLGPLDRDEPDGPRWKTEEGLGWQLHPVQNRDKWRWAIVDRPPVYKLEKELFAQGIERLIEYRISQLVTGLGTHGFVFDAGWSPELGAEFTRYLLGERYQPDGYQFEGFFVQPKISPSRLFLSWLDSARGWLEDVINDLDRLAPVVLEDYFFSMLGYVQPAFFSGKVSPSMSEVTVKPLIGLRILCNFDGFLSAVIAFNEVKGKKVYPANILVRNEFVHKLEARVMALPETHLFRAMWLRNKGKPMVTNHRHDPGEGTLTPEEDVVKEIAFGTAFFPPWRGNSGHNGLA